MARGHQSLVGYRAPRIGYETPIGAARLQVGALYAFLLAEASDNFTSNQYRVDGEGVLRIIGLSSPNYGSLLSASQFTIITALCRNSSLELNYTGQGVRIISGCTP
jgi:hypothetical protein